ncbi:YhcH/YjgK/YiaL family protein [Adhaeribacter aquaticus]|uniref:YhcH/YjgK/YiaL family protein n=1 Tax=Adhaeribacter aquaticus TaxID=299567 RepID=UPI00047D0790|nr:YhcH/YjgK/YiaL family protein [Adhaeribacter aquaticus]
MVLDKIENAHLYTSLGEGIAQAFKFITTTDFATAEPGKHEIDGDKVFAFVSEYDTKEITEGITEAHRKHLDVQFVYSGSEVFGYAPLKAQSVTQDYDDEKDLILFKADLSFNKLDAGMFAIFFPDDVHMPGVKLAQDTTSKVKKVVVKVRLT